MGFQSSVNMYQAPAVAGDLLNDNPVVYHDGTGIAGENGVEAGKFVWMALTNGQYIGSKAGEGAPAGVVQRVQRAYNFDIKSDASMVIGKGEAFSTIVLGEVAVVCTNPATVGKAIFVNNTTGAISCADSGASVEGATETKFKVYTLLGNASEANQLVGISTRL